MPASEALKRAVRKYEKENIRQIKFNLSLKYDRDVIEKLDSVPNKQGYIKDLIRADIARANSGKKEEEKKMKHMVQFEAGEGREISGGVNFLICLDIPELYAEIAVPEGASDDYGYLTLKARILEQARNLEIDTDTLEFWYDGQEDKLAADASAE